MDGYAPHVADRFEIHRYRHPRTFCNMPRRRGDEIDDKLLYAQKKHLDEKACRKQGIKQKNLEESKDKIKIEDHGTATQFHGLFYARQIPTR